MTLKKSYKIFTNLSWIIFTFYPSETDSSNRPQLRQGQQRRIKAVVKPVQKSGMLPIICQSLVSISVGCPVVRSELQKALDSYQVHM
jgi:hypothetical protein